MREFRKARQKALKQDEKYEEYETHGNDVLVDFDGTAADWSYPDIGAPKVGFKEAVEQFHRMGLRVVLWTSRMDPEIYTEEEITETYNKLWQWLVDHDIVIDEIDWGARGKRLALAYVDDRGISLTPVGGWKHAVKEVQRVQREVQQIRAERNK